MTAEKSKQVDLPAVRKTAASRVESSIRLLRGERVILDSDLADLYEVSPRALLQAVRRITICDLELGWSAISSVCVH